MANPVLPGNGTSREIGGLLQGMKFSGEQRSHGGGAAVLIFKMRESKHKERVQMGGLRCGCPLDAVKSDLV